MTDDMLKAIGALLVVGSLGIFLLGPWLLFSGLLAGAIVGHRWWRKVGRYKDLELADQKTVIQWRELISNWFAWFGIDSSCIHKKMLYLGNSADGTIRYWYDEGYYVPQAIDNGEFYWEKKVYIENPTLREKLDGFQDMGNEWPAYYQEVVLAKKRKKKIKEQEKEINKKANAAMAFMEEHPNALLDMQQTVEELRKEIEGYCPVIDFKGMSS